MGDTEDLLAWLRQKHQEMPDPEAGSFYSIAADEILDLRAEVALWREMYDKVAAADTRRSLLDRVLRAERDADRLAEVIRNVAEHELDAAACRLCVVLDLHEREVEAR